MGAALPEMNAAPTRADSAALAERFLASPPGGQASCGEMLAGFLLGMTASPSESAWRERQRAAELIERAMRSYGDEPRLYLALALLLHYRQSRTDALRVLARAAEREDRGEVPMSAREVAILHYTRGTIQQDFWRDWRSFGQLDAVSQGQWRCSHDQAPTQTNFSGSSTDFAWLTAVNQLCPDLFSDNMARYFLPRAAMNRDALRDLEREFEAAWEADATFRAPAEALLAEWVYAADWERAAGLVRRMAERSPHDPIVGLYEGLVLHETGRDSLAALAFARARDSLSPGVAAALEDIRPLLRPEQVQALDLLDSAGQHEVRIAFWTTVEPLFLTTWNERRLEHWSRVVAAGLLFPSTALSEAGWSTFAGQTWMRYGRPRHMWELQIPAGRVVFWDFGPGPDVSFYRGFGYRGYRPTDEAIQVANALSRSTPQTYALTALVDSVELLDVQLVRAFGADRRPQLLVYAAWPDSAPATAAAGLTLLDLQYMPVAQWRGRKPDRPGIGVELKGMAPGGYSLTLEVWDRDGRRLHRMRDTVSTLTARDTGLTVSDVLLVTAVASPRGDEASSRGDLVVTPLYGHTLSRGQPVGLVWETYQFAAGPEGRQRYRVSIEVLNTARQPVLTRILRRVGGDDGQRARDRIAYESTRPLVDGQAVEWIELTSDLAMGEYRLVLTLTDRATGVAHIRERALTVR
jgi:GWxTD domain-containing protein